MLDLKEMRNTAYNVSSYMVGRMILKPNALLIFIYTLLFLWRLTSGESHTITLCLFLTLLAIVRYVQHYNFLRSLPPGPWGLPILGTLRDIRSQLHLHFQGLSAKYGPILSTQLGNQLTIVLSDPKLIREAFRRDDMTGRPVTEFTALLEGYGLINIEGKLWKDQRKFVHDGLRQFGMSCVGRHRNKMEARIQAEVDGFVRVVGAAADAKIPIDLNPVLAVSISNVICGILMSIRFEHGDERFGRFMNLIAEGFQLFSSLEASFFVPILKLLPGQKLTRQKIARNREEMANFLQEVIDDHRCTFDPNNIRDILDMYFEEIRKAKEAGTSDQLFEGKNHDRQMQQILGDLFTAGMETIKSSLQWAVIFMLHNPEAMRAVQEELDQVVGRERLPCQDDLQYLPITEATIMEVLRISSIVPMGTMHSPTKDIVMNGYLLPKGSQIVPLLHTVHMNEKLWHEPTRFNPSRFINAEGKVVKPEYYLPFGVGRRMCLGEIMARMEIFAFFATLLHKFDVRLPAGNPLPSLEGNAGLTISPTDFKVYLKRRLLDGEVLPPMNAATVAGLDDGGLGGNLRSVGSH